jgi:hypothetical protein
VLVMKEASALASHRIARDRFDFDEPLGQRESGDADQGTRRRLSGPERLLGISDDGPKFGAIVAKTNRAVFIDSYKAIRAISWARGQVLRSILFPPDTKTHHPALSGDGFLPRFPARVVGFVLQLASLEALAQAANNGRQLRRPYFVGFIRPFRTSSPLGLFGAVSRLTSRK